MEQRITIELIESKEFGVENGGYNRKEVDRFLDQICDEIALMQDQMDELKRNLEVAEARTRTMPVVQEQQKPVVPDADFREILEMAQRVKSETIANAENKAKDIVDEAHAKAEEILGDLEAKKAALTDEVAALKVSAGDFRTKLSELVKEHLAVLDRSNGLF